MTSSISETHILSLITELTPKQLEYLVSDNELLSKLKNSFYDTIQIVQEKCPDERKSESLN